MAYDLPIVTDVHEAGQVALNILFFLCQVIPFSSNKGLFRLVCSISNTAFIITLSYPTFLVCGARIIAFKECAGYVLYAVSSSQQ